MAWNYGYPKDAGGFTFDSYVKEDKELKPENGDIRLLAVDNEAVVPVNKVVRAQVTAVDVIHSFVVQSFGVRIDAVPGRLNETWFKADREGVYYGQCSKICGKDQPSCRSPSGSSARTVPGLARRGEEEVRRRDGRDPCGGRPPSRRANRAEPADALTKTPRRRGHSRGRTVHGD